MLFGTRQTPAAQSANAKPKGRSVLNIMFNPQIGATIRPLEQTYRIFVQIIAMIFAMNGLFPKNHPILHYSPYDKTPAPKLKIRNILGIAWDGLEFTADGAPKVALFFAVILCFVLLAIGALIGVSMAFVGTAHAAPTCASGMFSPCSGSEDLAQNWLEFLFKDKSLGTDMQTAAPGIASSHAWQDAFITVLALYSDAILVVAAFILFYHLVSMVVETAHHGVPMGKRASQIWAPIRLVVAIGLLVPVSSGGLNSGQFIVIQMAEWGSGLGSQVWAKFVANLTSNAIAPPPTVYVQDQAEKIVQIAACVYTWNHILEKPNNNGTTTGTNTADDHIDPQTQTIANTGATIISYQNKPQQDPGKTYQNICGSVKLPGTASPTLSGTGNTASASDKIFTILAPAVKDAFQQAYQTAYTTATSEVTSALDGYFLDDNQSKPRPNTPDIIYDVAKAFQNALNDKLLAAMQGVVSQQSTMQDTWTRWGWASAGTYFNDIAAVQSVVTNTLRDAKTEVTAPAIFNSIGSMTGYPDPYLYNNTQKTLGEFREWAHSINFNKITNPSAPTPTPAPNTDKDTGLCKSVDFDIVDSVTKAIQGAWTSVTTNNSGGRPINMALNALDMLAAKNCVWKPYYNGNGPKLAIQFQSNNPLAEMAQLGQNNLNVAFDLLNFFIEIEAFKTVDAAAMAATSRLGIIGKTLGVGAKVLDTILGLVASIVSFLALIFFTCGVTLAFFVPLIPFTKFFFNLLSWIVMVLEAVVAVPLVALAHLNPEGEGLPGASAKTAYFFIFDIFLRPALMVFGLICGYLVFLAAVAFMNTMYQTAVVGTGGLGIDNSHLVFSRMFYSIMYVMLLYTAANNSFNLIHSIPEHALLWMGQRSLHKETIGDARDLAGHITAISGYAGQQALGQIQGALSGAQEKIKGIVPPPPPTTPRPPARRGR